jgi:hypothetical protein
MRIAAHVEDGKPIPGDRTRGAGLGASSCNAEALPMMETTRSEYPADMLRVAHPGMERGTVEEMTDQLLDSVSRYTREKPTTALLWAVGIGFVLGWKLKPW